MLKVKCAICKDTFYSKPYFVRKGWGKYCSRRCHHKGMQCREKYSCSTCGKEIWRTSGQAKNSKSRKYFCSKSCQTQWRNKFFSGSRHLLWKGGHNTYRHKLLRKDVPRVCNRCGLKDKKILAAHHLDHDRKNSSVDNLVWLCHNCHALVHRDRVEEQKFMATLV